MKNSSIPGGLKIEEGFTKLSTELLKSILSLKKEYPNIISEYLLKNTGVLSFMIYSSKISK
jgi:hypothetical protein